MNEDYFKKIGIVIVTLTVNTIIGFIFALPVQLLWNWLMPVIFNLPTITYIQAWGLLVISSYIIKSINVKFKY